MELSSMDNRVLSQGVIQYRPDKVSQPWSILDSYDKRLNAIIKAYQVSAKYFMIKVIDPDGSIIWSN